MDTASSTEYSLSCLQQDEFYFVGRYLGGKFAMSRQEAQDLSNAGIYVVSLWKIDGNEMSYFDTANGYSNGYNDGFTAFTTADNTFGQPSGTPVYFAVDTDLTSTYQTGLQDYFNGVLKGREAYVNSQIHRGLPAQSYEIGVYGGYDTLQWCYEQEITSFYWQASPPDWSGGRNARQWTHVNIVQSLPVYICNGELQVDPDTGVTDPGGWKI
jgi:hypothetical protein